MSRHLIALVVTAAIWAVAGPAFAHHGTAAFDLSQQITVKGTVTEFVFANPHSLVHFDVKNDKGEVERWMAELTAPTKLARGGWNKRTLKAGDTISVTGPVSKSANRTIWTQKFVGPDGPLPINENDQ
jgi:DNA/RNA endonuclease YhcR with UshA esterase domain